MHRNKCDINPIFFNDPQQLPSEISLHLKQMMIYLADQCALIVFGTIPRTEI